MVSRKCIIEPSLFTNIKGVVQLFTIATGTKYWTSNSNYTLKTWTYGWTTFNSPLLINVFEKYSKVNICKLISI